jgi:glycosyltransferase involved in cell wall biosynthesis
VLILHVITTADIGGAEKQLLILAREQIKQGKGVSVLYLKGRGELNDDFRCSGVTVIDRLSNKNLFTQLKNLRKILKEGWDIIHCHLPRAEILTHLAAKKNLPILVSRHFGGEFFPGMGAGISKVLSRFFTRKVSCVIAISDSVNTYLVDSKEIKGIPIEVVDYAFPKPKTLLDFKKEKHFDAPIIGVVSRLSKEKRVHLAIDIFNNFLKVAPNAKLQICGEGSELLNLQKQIEDLGIEDKVEILGKVKNINDYYAHFDLLLHTSEFEGFGMVYIEAMCFNLPIIYLSNSGLMYTIGQVFGTRLIEKYQDSSYTNRELQEAMKLDPVRVSESYGAVLEKFSTARMESKLSEIYSLHLQREP